MSYTVKRLLEICVAELDYHEKASNAMLDSPSANAGAGNYTKYARDLASAGYYNGNKQGFAWCDVWVDWCFYQLCDKDPVKAQWMICQTGDSGAGCRYSMDYYKAQGRLYSSPLPGDQIFFQSNGDIVHTGIVESVNATHVTTIEGNTSDKVARRIYKINDASIAGYGRPKFDLEAPAPVIKEESKMKYSKENPPMQCMMTQSTCYRGTSKMSVKGVLWHSTGANNPNIKRYVQPDDDAPNKNELLAKLGVNTSHNDWNHVYTQAGLNCWIGKLADGTVATVQTMPWDYMPWGCGGGYNGSCNNGWIQFEVCEDSLTDANYCNQVYREACEITAYLCTLYNINPNGYVNVNGVQVPTILCHNDSYRLGMGSNHADVNHWFPKFGKTMATARADVAALMGKENIPVNPPVNPSPVITNKPLLAKGSEGEYVRELQESLTKLGYDCKGVDGIFGNNTYNAVIAFQRASGIDVDGMVGNQTWGKISEALNKTDVSSPVIKPTESAPENTIKPGDTVSIKAGAKYYSGNTIPNWVVNTKWIVYRVDKDKVIINKDVDGKYAIMSPVNIKDLIVESNSIDKTSDEYSIGEIVYFKGNQHYIGATSMSGSACKPGLAKVTAISNSTIAKHPIHLVYIPGEKSTVNGWVDKNNIEKRS